MRRQQKHANEATYQANETTKNRQRRQTRQVDQITEAKGTITANAILTRQTNKQIIPSRGDKHRHAKETHPNKQRRQTRHAKKIIEAKETNKTEKHIDKTNQQANETKQRRQANQAKGTAQI